MTVDLPLALRPAADIHFELILHNGDGQLCTRMLTDVGDIVDQCRWLLDQQIRFHLLRVAVQADPAHARPPFRIAIGVTESMAAYLTKGTSP